MSERMSRWIGETTVPSRLSMSELCLLQGSMVVCICWNGVSANMYPCNHKIALIQPVWHKWMQLFWPTEVKLKKKWAKFFWHLKDLKVRKEKEAGTKQVWSYRNYSSWQNNKFTSFSRERLKHRPNGRNTIFDYILCTKWCLMGQPLFDIAHSWMAWIGANIKNCEFSITLWCIFSCLQSICFVCLFVFLLK